MKNQSEIRFREIVLKSELERERGLNIAINALNECVGESLTKESMKLDESVNMCFISLLCILAGFPVKRTTTKDKKGEEEGSRTCWTLLLLLSSNQIYVRLRGPNSDWLIVKTSNFSSTTMPPAPPPGTSDALLLSVSRENINEFNSSFYVLSVTNSLFLCIYIIWKKCSIRIIKVNGKCGS